MKRLIIVAAVLCTTVVVAAQQPAMGGMPMGAPPAGQHHETLSPKAQAAATINGKAITIDYSSPRVKGREGKIFTKDGLISHDKDYPFWRAGANDATTLKTAAPIMIGNLMIPAGTYTLFVDISDPANWTLVVSKAVGEWGLDYDKTKDLGRVKMKMAKPGAMVENLTWTIAGTHGMDGTITLAWENVSASVPLMVH
jgi:hypothetical protein